MTFIPPTTEPLQPHQRILTDGLIPNVAGAYPNSKAGIWTNPGNSGHDRAFVITVVWLHNTHAVDTYSCSWASSFSPFVVYSPSAAVPDRGTDDPGIELGNIDLAPKAIASFTDPITIYPGETFYGVQAKKGTITGKAINLRLYGHWEPLA